MPAGRGSALAPALNVDGLNLIQSQEAKALGLSVPTSLLARPTKWSNVCLLWHFNLGCEAREGLSANDPKRTLLPLRPIARQSALAAPSKEKLLWRIVIWSE